MAHTSTHCPSCGNDIQPGETRKPTEEGTKHDYCVLHDSLFEKYTFYIVNPPKDNAYGISFWRVYDDGTEFPVMSKSNEIIVNSSSPTYAASNAIEPTDKFFKTVEYSIQYLMAFTGGLPPLRQDRPPVREHMIEESFERAEDVFYENTRMPKHEKEIGKAIVTQIIPQSFPYIIQELKPIRDFADKCTKFNLPEVHPRL